MASFLLLLSLSFVPSHRSFRLSLISRLSSSPIAAAGNNPHRHRQHLLSRCPLVASLQLRVNAHDDLLLSTTNQSEALLQLIAFGEKWQFKQRDNNSVIDRIDLLTQQDGYEPVPGCMATVKVKVEAEIDPSKDRVNEREDFTQRRVRVRGMADSRVALGMLAYLSHELQGKTVYEVLDYCATRSERTEVLRKMLPPGRLNGFDNMVGVIQRQTTRLLEHETQIAVPNPPIPTIDARQDEIAVLLSGGVDSSVVLAELVRQAHKVRAYYLKIWLEDEIAHLNQCPWEEDLQYAMAVCKQLSVPLETLSLQKEYWEHVVAYTLHECKQGRTPNPDIMCNAYVKFGMFQEYVGKFHRKIATGHYAQTVTLSAKDDDDYSVKELKKALCEKWGYNVHQVCATSNKILLRQSPDPIKDQSYFLCNLSQEQLQRCMFPIGHLQKEQVRTLASDAVHNLPTQLRKDSQGICFLGKLKFDDFIRHYLGEQSGEIRDYVTNEVLGYHKGLWFHTQGQRKGLGPVLSASGCVHRGPWYVASKDIESNVLYVTNNVTVIDAPRLTFTVPVDEFNWLLGEAPPVLTTGNSPLRVRLKLRHGPTMYDGTMMVDSNNHQLYRITLDKKDKGIAPGQFAAIYEGDVCLGAGVINNIGL